MSCCGSLFIILVFHEEDYLCGTYRYTNSVQHGYFWEYKLESCLEKRNYSFICAGGMFFYYSYYILKYVVLHSAFRGGSSVFTKRPMAHLKWSIHNAKVPWKCCGPSCTIQMKWSSTDGRHCSYLIIITFCRILGYRKESWKLNVKGHMQHWTLDTERRHIKRKTQHRKLQR